MKLLSFNASTYSSLLSNIVFHYTCKHDLHLEIMHIFLPSNSGTVDAHRARDPCPFLSYLVHPPLFQKRTSFMDDAKDIALFRAQTVCNLIELHPVLNSCSELSIFYFYISCYKVLIEIYVEQQGCRYLNRWNGSIDPVDHQHALAGAFLSIIVLNTAFVLNLKHGDLK